MAKEIKLLYSKQKGVVSLIFHGFDVYKFMFFESTFWNQEVIRIAITI